MSWFSSKSRYEDPVMIATSDTNTQENWAKIMEICDMINQNGSADDCVKEMTKRLIHKNPNVQRQAIKLISACVNNCTRDLLIAVCSHAFVKEIKRLLDPRVGNPTHPTVQKELKELLVEMERLFLGDGQLGIIHNTMEELKKQGLDFGDVGSSDIGPGGPSSSPGQVSTTQRANDIAAQEADDLAMALAASMSEQEAKVSSQPMPNAASCMKPKSAKCLYDFEATEENELSFAAGNVIVVTNNGDPNWWFGSDQREKEGYFPASFVTFDLAAEIEKEIAPVAEAPPRVKIDEDKLDHCLDGLYDIMKDGAVDRLQGLSTLKSECEQMTPLIDKQIEVFDVAEKDLQALSDRFEKAIALYQQMKTARPMPAAAAPHLGIVARTPMGGNSAPPPPQALFGQHPSTYTQHNNGAGAMHASVPPVHTTPTYHGNIPIKQLHHPPSQQQDFNPGPSCAQPSPQQHHIQPLAQQQQSIQQHRQQQNQIPPQAQSQQKQQQQQQQSLLLSQQPLQHQFGTVSSHAQRPPAPHHAVSAPVSQQHTPQPQLPINGNHSGDLPSDLFSQVPLGYKAAQSQQIQSSPLTAQQIMQQEHTQQYEQRQQQGAPPLHSQQQQHQRQHQHQSSLPALQKQPPQVQQHQPSGGGFMSPGQFQ